MYTKPEDEKDRLEEDDLIDKIPAKYKDLYESEDFEKFNRGKDWWD
jgi:hypothetical protein